MPPAEEGYSEPALVQAVRDMVPWQKDPKVLLNKLKAAQEALDPEEHDDFQYFFEEAYNAFEPAVLVRPKVKEAWKKLKEALTPPPEKKDKKIKFNDIAIPLENLLVEMAAA